MRLFDAAYTRTRGGPHPNRPGNETAIGIQRLLGEYGGSVYNDGIYSIFHADDGARWTETLKTFFPAESSDVGAFARDWQGNMFGYRGGSQPCVLLFQPGTGDVFEVAESIASFHNEELTQHPEEALSLSLWKQWRALSQPPSGAQCVAYKKPIFLGGDVAIDNLTLADINVYWEVMGQLLLQVHDLPDGTPIESVRLTYLNSSDAP